MRRRKQIVSLLAVSILIATTIFCGCGNGSANGGIVKEDKTILVNPFKVVVHSYSVDNGTYYIESETPTIEGTTKDGSINAFFKDANDSHKEYISQISDLVSQAGGSNDKELSKDEKGLFESNCKVYKGNRVTSVVVKYKTEFPGILYPKYDLYAKTIDNITGDDYQSLEDLLGNEKVKTYESAIISRIKEKPKAYKEDAVSKVQGYHGEFNYYVHDDNVVIFFGVGELQTMGEDIQKFSFKL